MTAAMAKVGESPILSFRRTRYKRIIHGKKIFGGVCHLFRIQNLRRVVGLVWRSSPRWAIAYMIANILQSLLPLILLYITKLVIDRIALDIGGYDKQNVITDVTLLLINASLVILLTTFNSVATEICSANLFQRVTDYCQITIFKKAIAIDLEDYESPENQEVLERANLETPQRLNRILNALTSICQNLTSLILISLLLISINWIVLAILIVAGIPTMLIRSWQSQHNYKWRSRQDEINRESSYFGDLLIGNASIKELHIFNLGDFFIQKFSDLKQQILGLSFKPC
jgi:ATP-binding cassette subfamily B protein